MDLQGLDEWERVFPGSTAQPHQGGFELSFSKLSLGRYELEQVGRSVL